MEGSSADGTVVAGPLSAWEEKARIAEKNVAPVRVAVVLFNIVVYWPWLYPLGLPALAAVVCVVSFAYAGYVWVFRPYVTWPVMAASATTTVIDGLLITVWLFATGGFASPFYLLWYISLFAVTFRYDWKATLAATAAYSIAYLALLAILGDIATHGVDVLIRTGYILLTGALGALMAFQTTKNLNEQYRVGKRLSEVDHLRKMNLFRRQFISTAAHELRTPLTPMRSQVMLLRKMQPKDGEGTEQTQGLDILDRNLERMSGLVEELLLAARNQTGELGIEPDGGNLHKLVMQEARSFLETAKKKDIRLEVRTGGDGAARFDQNRIAQVLANLLSNAIKFTEPGGNVTVHSIGRLDHIEVEVQDTGRGIRQRDLKQLFQPFVQVHDTHQVSAPGSGLGLYISKAIIDLHGGRIRVDSPGRGKGTTATFTIPRKLPRTRRETTASPRPEERPIATP